MLLILGLIGLCLMASFFGIVLITAMGMLVFSSWLFGCVGFFIAWMVLLLLVVLYKLKR